MILCLSRFLDQHTIMPRNRTILLLLFFIFAFCLSSNGVHAFGAGNIPSFAYMEGRAFRHGDIEDILSTLAKKGAGGGFALASMLGGGGSKFNGLDIKRIYFGQEIGCATTVRRSILLRSRSFSCRRLSTFAWSLALWHTAMPPTSLRLLLSV